MTGTTTRTKEHCYRCRRRHLACCHRRRRRFFLQLCFRELCSTWPRRRQRRQSCRGCDSPEASSSRRRGAWLRGTRRLERTSIYYFFFNFFNVFFCARKRESRNEGSFIFFLDDFRRETRARKKEKEKERKTLPKKWEPDSRLSSLTPRMAISVSSSDDTRSWRACARARERDGSEKDITSPSFFSHRKKTIASIEKKQRPLCEATRQGS